MEGISEFLKKREDEGTLRVLRPVSSRRGSMIRIGGRDYIDFSSNDYLGLAGHPKLAEAAKKATDEFGTSSSASRLLSGDTTLHHALEKTVAEFKHKEAALVFNSGYQANLGILSGLYGRQDAVFCDRLNHASIIDGILLSGARLFRFSHNDPAHLERLLEKERRNFKNALIATETIFSMDGDSAPLKDLVRLKERYDCKIMVDEAHATGIFGRCGSGMVEEEALSERVDLIMGTFSKALGSFGAYLAASKKIIEYLVNTSRGFIYSTALPASIIAADLASIELVKEEPYRRKYLLNNARRFREALKDAGLDVRGSSQIVPIIVGENKKAVDAARILQEKGFWVLAIRPPTVPSGEARLRFSLTYYHDEDILKRLVNEISRIKI